MNLYSYLSTINRLWNNEDGFGVARFITLGGNHAKNPNLHTDKPEDPVSRTIASPLDEVISFHLKVLYNLHSDRKSL
jgi:nuclear mRNA export protein PCID2/THP1